VRYPSRAEAFVIAEAVPGIDTRTLAVAAGEQDETEVASWLRERIDQDPS
jgi:hypothetical protein